MVGGGTKTFSGARSDCPFAFAVIALALEVTAKKNPFC